MSTDSQEASAPGTEVVVAPPSLCAKIAEQGLSTSRDIKRFTAAIAVDVVLNAMDWRRANAAANAIGKTLKTWELELKMAERGGQSLDSVVVVE